MTQKNIKKLFRWPGILVPILLAAAGLFAISGINKPHLSPFADRVVFEMPSATWASDKYKAVVDSSQKRLLILNAEDKLVSIVDMQKSGSPINKITDVCVEGETVYVLGYSVMNEGIYLTGEKVVTYGINGRVGETLYSKNYDNESKVTNPYFAKICAQDSRIVLCGFSDTTASLSELDGGELKKVWTATAPETICSIIYRPLEGNVFAIGRSGNYYSATLDGGTFARTTENIQYENPDLISQNYAYYSTGFFIGNILHWLSVLIVGLLLLALIIWLIIKKLDAKGRGIAALVVLILFTAVFYSVSSQNSSEAIIHDALISGGNQMGIMMSEQFGDDFRNIIDEGIEDYCKDIDNRQMIDEHQNILRRLADAGGIGKGMVLSLDLIGRDGNVYSYVDSRNRYPAGMKVELTEEQITALRDYEGDYVISLKGTEDRVVYHYSFIHDSEGTEVGVLNVGCLRGNLDYYLWQNTINLFITLVCVMIAIIMTVSLIKTFSGDIRRMRSRAPEDMASKSVDMCGMFYFLLECIFGVDSAIHVYVSKSLCAGLAPAQEAVMVAMPLSSYFAGGFLGCLIYSRIVKRIGEKLLSFIACIAIICSFLLMILALQSQNILFLIVGKFIEGIFLNGTIAPMGELIPFAAKDDQVKRDAMNSTVKGAAGAGVISILVGGILATVFSYQAMYLLGIGMTLLLLLLSLRIFKGGAKERDTGDDARSVSLKGSWRVFLRMPMVICILLFLLPMSVLDGYTSYLFPMFTAGAGISAMLLSNLTVFAKTITFGFNRKIDSVLKTLNKHTAMVIVGIIFCIGLVCFVLSPNVYWAIIMYLVSDVVTRVLRSQSKLFMMDISREYNVDNTAVQAHFRSLNSALKSCRGPILSAVVMLGMNFACAVVGLVNGIAMATFRVYLGKRKETKKP